MRLIRSKGVGVYFITQNPIDIPDTVAGQLGNRVQHKLNAFTPRDQTAVQAAAETFRANPGVDVATAITELKVGEALVSLLQPDGAPSPVQRTLIKPPGSRVGPVTPVERGVLIQTDAIGDKYDTLIDRESAEELLAAKSAEATAAAAQAKRPPTPTRPPPRRPRPTPSLPRRPNARAWPRNATPTARPGSTRRHSAPPSARPRTVREPRDPHRDPLRHQLGRHGRRARSHQGGVRQIGRRRRWHPWRHRPRRAGRHFPRALIALSCVMHPGATPLGCVTFGAGGGRGSRNRFRGDA